MKHDQRWQVAYQEYCASRGVAEHDLKSQDKEFITTFIERNLANFINQEWAKKIIYSAPGEKKQKKDKKDKKEKKAKTKKDKKRKASDSSSSEQVNVGNAVGASSTGPAPGQGIEMPMAAMNMYG